MAKEAAHSKNFEKVKKFFDSNLWSKQRVRNAVENPVSNPWITLEEYKEITGEEYESGSEG